MSLLPVGHESLVESLRSELPHAALLLGPRSTGKRTIVDHVISHHGYREVDVVGGDQRLLVPLAEEIIERCKVRPIGKTGRLVTADLDGASSEAANMVLKLIEEPPAKTKFLFTASRQPLLTIMSRCHVYRTGLLSEEQVTEVLENRLGVEEREAERLAGMSGGTIAGALRADAADANRGQILSALRAVSTDDEELLGNALRKLDEDGRWLLRRWAVEARTGQWRLFSKEESFGLESDTRQLELLISTLDRSGSPRLGAMVALTRWRRARARGA